MAIPMSAANFPNILDVFSSFCDQIMMVFVTIRFVMSSAKMVNDASKMSPVTRALRMQIFRVFIHFLAIPFPFRDLFTVHIIEERKGQ